MHGFQKERSRATTAMWKILAHRVILASLCMFVLVWNGGAQSKQTASAERSQLTATASSPTPQPTTALERATLPESGIVAPSTASSSVECRAVVTVALVKDVLNALFFLVVGSITILTYRRAKQTILQPLRTEIFKQQIQLFSDLLRLFVGKSESDLRDKFAFERMLRANVQFQCDLYLRVQFGAVLDESKRLYNRTHCPSSEFVIGFDEMPDEPPVDGVINMPIMPRTWIGYIPREVRIPIEYTQMREQVVEFLESPLTPKELAVHLEALLELLSKNVDHIRAALSEYVPQMPALCPTLEHRTRLTTTPAHNLFFQRFEALKPVADDVVGYIRSYFAVEKLMTAE